MSNRFTTFESSSALNVFSGCTSIIFGPWLVSHMDTFRIHIRNCSTRIIGVQLQHAPISGDSSIWKTFNAASTLSASRIGVCEVLSVALDTDNTINYVRVLATATTTVGNTQLTAFVMGRKNY